MKTKTVIYYDGICILCSSVMNALIKMDKSNILYKCGWSPFEGTKFNSVVTHTFVNGNLVYNNGEFDESCRGSKILFK